MQNNLVVVEIMRIRIDAIRRMLVKKNAGVCLSCGKPKKIVGHGNCTGCYQRVNTKHKQLKLISATKASRYINRLVRDEKWIPPYIRNAETVVY